MAKNVIKEMFIVLLLCLAIILILGILLYDYVPMSKTVPSPVSYVAPETLKQELQEAEKTDLDKIIMTYEVDSADLNVYKAIQKYKPGKENPFEAYVVNQEEGGPENTGSTGTATTGETSPNTQSNVGSEGEYFQNKGTK